MDKPDYPHITPSAFTTVEIKDLIDDISNRIPNTIENNGEDFNPAEWGKWSCNNMEFTRIFTSGHSISCYGNKIIGLNYTFTWTPRLPLNLTPQDLESFQTLTSRLKATDNNSRVMGSPIIISSSPLMNCEHFQMKCLMAIQDAFTDFFNERQLNSENASVYGYCSIL